MIHWRYKVKRFSIKDNKKIVTVDEALKNLNNLYAKIPDTSGCLENIVKENGCKGWCCKLQSPQVLNIEFINTWNYILNNFSNDEILELIERAFRNYLSNDFSKGCIFWDSETKLCKIYKVKPFNCFLYGITPDDEFKARYERMKEEHKGEIGAIIRPQCDLVSVVDGNKPTIDEANKWWEILRKIEQSIGIDVNSIHDGTGGTYRTYHDYILMKFISPEILHQMTILRLHGHVEEKEQFIYNSMAYIKKRLLILTEEKINAKSQKNKDT